MARPRAFDTDQAITSAMNVFWRLGYEGASLPDLLEGMGLTRWSLYKAFTDKRSLFMTVFQRYEEHAVAPAVALLNDDSILDGIERIERLFQSVVKAVRDGDRRGCLLCSAAAGPASDDAEIAGVVSDLLMQMETGFAVALSASHKHAALPSAERSELATLLMSQYVGLRILVRAQTSADQMEQSVTAVQKLLRGG